MSLSGKQAFVAVSLSCMAAVVGIGTVATSIDSLARFEAALVRERPPVAEPVQISAVLSNDEWMSSLRSEQAWTKRRSATPAASSPSAKPGQAKAPPPQAAPWGLFGGLFEPDPDLMSLPASRPLSNTYRTVCVRMCDGYFFPISFSTTRERFAADEAKCQSSCSADARLFVYRNPGEEPESMVDLGGRPYAKMKTAFLYRTAYDASCKCTAHPWEQEARLKHRVYALEAQRKKGNKQVIAELKDLKSAISQTTQSTDSGKRRSTKKASTAATVAGPATAPASAPVAIEGPAPGALKAAGDPSLASPPATQRTRVAEGGRPMQRAMRLGAPPPAPAGSGASGDWKRRVLSGGM